MPPRLKRFIGSLVLVALVIVYSLVATAVAVARLADAGALTHFFFFLISGLLWVLPAMVVIKWMMVSPKG